MKYRPLGRSGLKVSAITMGTFTFGGQGAFAMTGKQGVPEAQRLIGTDLAIVTVKRLGAYLLKNLGAHSASGECTVLDQGYDLGLIDPLEVGPGLYGFEIFFHCADPRGLVLRNTAVFARDSDHVNIASVFLNGRVSEQIFTPRTQRLAIPDAGSLAPVSFFSYVGLGAEHLLDGADRLCVVLGLALLVRRRRDVAYLVGALALGYALAAVVSSMGWVAPRLTLVDAFVALLAALSGLTVAVRNTERGPAVAAAWSALLLLAGVVCAISRLVPTGLLLLGGAALSAGLLVLAGPRERVAWPILAGLLGFLDGFVWSAAIEPAELSASAHLDMTAGLYSGALLTEVVLLGVLVGVTRLMQSYKPFPRQLVNDVCAACLAGLGTYWLVGRLFA
jgi:hypothetical protein